MKYCLILLAIALAVLVVSVEPRRVQNKRASSAIEFIERGKSKSKSRSKSKSESKSKSDSDDDLEDIGRLALKRAARAERQKQQVLRLYHNIINPTSSYIAYEIERMNYTVVEDYLTYNVTGRINPLGRFDTFFSTGEYFYSLAGPLPGVPTAGKSRVTHVWWTQPITCSNNSCWYRADIGMSRFDDNVNDRNYTHIGVANFDETDRICSYEANFLGIERTLNLPENNAYRQAAYTGLCANIMGSCVGPNLQYEGNLTKCVEFFNTIPYGGWGVADQNTVACRILHSALVRGNPETHCPHVGETGGDKCIYHASNTYYEDNINDCRDKNW